MHNASLEKKISSSERVLSLSLSRIKPKIVTVSKEMRRVYIRRLRRKSATEKFY